MAEDNDFNAYYDLVAGINIDTFENNLVNSYKNINNFKEKYNKVVSFYQEIKELPYYLFSKPTPFTFSDHLLVVLRSITQGIFEIYGTIAVVQKESIPTIQNRSFPPSGRPEKIYNKGIIKPGNIPNSNYELIFHVDKTHQFDKSNISYNRAIYFHIHPMDQGHLKRKDLGKLFYEISEILSPPNINDIIVSFNRLTNYDNDIVMVFSYGGMYVFQKKKLTLPSFKKDEEYLETVQKVQKTMGVRINSFKEEMSKEFSKIIINIVNKIFKLELPDKGFDTLQKVSLEKYPKGPTQRIDFNLEGQNFRNEITNSLFNTNENRKIVQEEMNQLMGYINNKYELPENMKEILKNVDEFSITSTFYTLESTVSMSDTHGMMRALKYPNIEVKVYPRISKFRGAQTFKDLQ